MFRNTITAAALVVTVLINPSRALAQNPEVVVAWNQVLQSVSPGLWRPYAMVHVAMFDAINAIEGD